jgi:hypothetical protein
MSLLFGRQGLYICSSAHEHDNCWTVQLGLFYWCESSDKITSHDMTDMDIGKHMNVFTHMHINLSYICGCQHT